MFLSFFAVAVVPYPRPAPTARVPHPSRFCEGWERKPFPSTVPSLPLPILPSTTPTAVISTEATQSLTVSGAVGETPAFLPLPLPALVIAIPHLSSNRHASLFFTPQNPAKSACQPPPPPNPIQTNHIHLPIHSLQSHTIKIGQKAEFFFRMNTLAIKYLE